jgi:RimJ/RimL family protein N-acetyltransferase
MTSSVEVPVLTTARLTLRGHRLEDFEPVAAMWGNALVTRHIGGRPSTREESWARLLRYIGHWAALDFGFWAVTETASGRFLGEAGLADFKRDIAWPADFPMDGPFMPEIGWAFDPTHHGKGYATEAVSAITAWADRRFAGSRSLCLIDPDNAASLRVAEKCGYAQIGATEYKGGPTLVLLRAH